MAPEFENCEEITEIIKNLRDKREDLFGDLFKFVNPDMIACGLRIDKEASPAQKWILKIEGIKGSRTLLTDKKYLIHGFANMWWACSTPQKVAHVANMLRRIAYPTIEELNKLAEKGKSYEFGKIVKPDIADFSTFIKAFGVDYAELGNIIPNLAETDIQV